MIEKTIDGKTYRFRSVGDDPLHKSWNPEDSGCRMCAANRNISLCNALDDNCLDFDGSYWKEHIGIKPCKK